MRRTGNDWPPASHLPTLLLLSLALAIALGACATSAAPEEVVDSYLLEARRGDNRSALQSWELSQLGPAPVDLDPGQQSIRLETRRELAQALTDALSAAGESLSSERTALLLYDIQDGVATLTESVDEANVATVEVSLAVDRSGGEDAEEQLAFTLWRSADGVWRITGLDKGLPVLEDFLEKLRGS